MVTFLSRVAKWLAVDDVPAGPVVFVLSGGGARGAAQAGMLAALLEAGIVPDIIVGTSVGALNGAAIAASPTVEQAHRLETYWRRVATRDIFPFPNFITAARLLTGGDHLLSDAGLRRLVADWLDQDDIADLEVPLHVTTTSLSDGRQAVHTSGSPQEVLVASASIPGLFRPVRLADGNLHVDGGVAANVPVQYALSLNPSQVWVLDLSPELAPGNEPVTGSAVVAVCLAAALQSQDFSWVDDPRVTRIRAANTSAGILSSVVSFKKSAELVEAGRAAVEEALADALPDAA
jgi:NTE family protein